MASGFSGGDNGCLTSTAAKIGRWLTSLVATTPLFSANPYRDLYQHVFKAETAEYKLTVGYDGVKGETTLRVEFKADCQLSDWPIRYCRVKMVYPDRREAIARAIRFVSQHSATLPVCHLTESPEI